MRLCNFRIDSNSVTYDESVRKNYYGGLKDLKYNPRVVRYVYCTRNNVNHARCIVKCYAKYMEKTKQLTEKREAFYLKPNLNSEILQYYDVVMSMNTLNQILPNLCKSAGLSRENVSLILRVTCPTRLFHSNVAEKLIRERTGHRCNGLLTYEKKKVRSRS